MIEPQGPPTKDPLGILGGEAKAAVPQKQQADPLGILESPKTPASQPVSAPQGVASGPSTGSPTPLPAASAPPAMDGVPEIPTDPSTPIAPMAPEHPVPDWAAAMPPAEEPPPAPERPKVFAAGEGGGIVQLDGTVKDARLARLEEDFATQAPMKAALGKDVRQYDPEREAAMRTAGTWTAGDEQRKQQGMLTVQADLLRERAKKLDDRLAKDDMPALNYKGEELQMMAGQLTEMDKRAKAGEAVDPAQYNDLVQRYNTDLKAWKAQMDPIAQEQADIKAGFAFLQEHGMNVAKAYAQDPAVRAAEADQAITDARDKRADEAWRKGDYLNADLWNNAMHHLSGPVTGSLLKAAGSLGRVLGAAQAPLDRAFGNSDYNAFTEAADNLNLAADEIVKTPTRISQSMFDENNDVRTDVVLPKLLEAATSMAVLAMGGAAGGNAGLVGASFATTEEDYYKEGINAGLTPGQAQGFSMTAATVTSLLEMVNPGPLVDGKTVKGAMLERAAAAIRDGMTYREATADATKYIIKEGGFEGLQEGSQAFGDVAVRNITNAMIGDDKLDGSVNIHDTAEQVFMGVALGSIAATGARIADRPVHLQALDWAVRNHDKVVEFINNSPYENKAELLKNFDAIYSKYRGNGLMELPPEQSQKVAVDLQKKEDIEEDMRKAPMDPVVAAAKGDPRDKKLEKVSRDVLTGMGITGQEQEDALINEGIIDAPLDAEGKPIKPKKKLQSNGGATSEGDVSPGVRHDQADATGESIPLSVEGSGVGTEPGGPSVHADHIEPKLTQDVSDDPQALASAYLDDLYVHHDEGNPDSVLGGLTKGNVRTESYYEHGDRNNVADGFAKQFLRKGGEPLDQIAMQVSEITGRNVSEQDVVDFMHNNPGGRPLRSERMAELADRYKAVTGKKLDKRIARKLLEAAKHDPIAEAAMVHGVDEQAVLDAHDVAEAQWDAMSPEEQAQFWQDQEEALNSVTDEAHQDVHPEAAPPSDRVPGGDVGQEATAAGAEPAPGEVDLTPEFRQRGRTLAARIRGLKINTSGGQAYATFIPPQVFNGVVEAVAISVEAGAEVAQAIADGIKHMRGTPWYQKLANSGKGGQVDAEKTLRRILQDPKTNDLRTAYEVADQKQAEDAKAKEKSKARLVREWYVRNFEDVRGIAKELLNEAGAIEAAIKLNLTAGASAAAKERYTGFQKAIHGGLNTDEKSLLNKMIEQRRIINLDMRYDADGRERLKHPSGKTMESAQEDMAVQRERDPARFDKLNARADAYFDAMRQMLKMRLGEGIISQELYDKLKDDEYSPREFIHHLLDAEQRNKTGTTDVGGNGLKKLAQGSEEGLYRNSEWLLANTVASTYRLAFNNRANKALGEFAEANPDNDIAKPMQPIGAKEGQPQYGEPGTGFQTVHYFDKGVSKAVAVANEIATPWLKAEPLMKAEWANAIRLATGGSLVRLFVTGINPAFALRNIPRDFGHVLLFTDNYSAVLPVGVAQLGKDAAAVFKDSIMRKGRFHDYIKEGGGMDFLTRQGHAFKSPDGAQGPARNAWEKTARGIDKAQSILGFLNETSEIMTRLAIRERQIAKLSERFEAENGAKPMGQDLDWIKRQATAKAREQMDFNQGGQLAKAADTAIPYLNAAFQGTRVAARSVRKQPLLTGVKLAQLGAAVTALTLYNMKYDDWDDVPQDVKDNNIIIMLPTTVKNKQGQTVRQYIAIPKPQESRIPASVFEVATQYAQTGKWPDGRVAFSLQNGLPPLDPRGIPLIDALNSYATGYDRYHDKFVTDPTANVEPYAEFNEGKTAALFKDIGQWTASKDENGNLTGGVSPARAQLATEKLTGLNDHNIYSIAASKGYDMVMESMGKQDRDEMNKSMAKHVEELAAPLGAGYVRLTQPSDGTDALKKLDRAAQTDKKLVNEMVKRHLNAFYDADTEEAKKKAMQAAAEDIFKLPPGEQKRALDRYTLGREHRGLPYFFVNLYYEQSPEVKGKAFFEQYDKASAEEKPKMLGYANQIGLFTPTVMEAFAKAGHDKKKQEQALQGK